MAPRKYQQRLRAATAEGTKRRILDAVIENLRKTPQHPLSLDKIAKAAGVSRSTIYLVFGSRAGLFDALGRDLRDRGGFSDIMRAAADPDARQALVTAVDACIRMYASHRDVLRALTSMAELDVDAFAGSVRRMEDGRAQGMSTLVRRLDAAKELRPELTLQDAVDTLWLLTAFDSFDNLYTKRERDVDTISSTLCAIAERALCRDVTANRGA